MMMTQALQHTDVTIGLTGLSRMMPVGGPSWIATVPPLARGQIQHQGCRTPQSLLGIEPFQSRLDSFLLGFHAQTWPALELPTQGSQLAHV